jgi:hypothetical protein
MQQGEESELQLSGGTNELENTNTKTCTVSTSIRL